MLPPESLGPREEPRLPIERQAQSLPPGLRTFRDYGRRPDDERAAFTVTGPSLLCHQFHSEVQIVRRARRHRPFHLDGREATRLRENLPRKCRDLPSTFPHQAEPHLDFPWRTSPVRDSRTKLRNLAHPIARISRRCFTQIDTIEEPVDHGREQFRGTISTFSKEVAVRHAEECPT